MRISDWSSDVCSSDLGAIGFEFIADDAVAGGDIFVVGVDQMEQHAAALDMAQKAVADAGAVGRALAQAGNVGEDEFMPLVADDAELWAPGRERRGASSCLRVAYRVTEGRLAGVGQAGLPGGGAQVQPQ